MGKMWECGRFPREEMHFLSWSNPAKLSRSRFHILEFKSSLGSSRNIPPAPALPIKIPVLPFPPGLGKRGQQIPGRSRLDSPIFHRILQDLPFCELPGREAKKIPEAKFQGREDGERRTRSRSSWQDLFGFFSSLSKILPEFGGRTSGWSPSNFSLSPAPSRGAGNSRPDSSLEGQLPSAVAKCFHRCPALIHSGTTKKFLFLESEGNSSRE